jgi:hypothetical protein
MTVAPRTSTATLCGLLIDFISTICFVSNLSTAFKLSANFIFASCTFKSTSLAISNACSVWIFAYYYYFVTIRYVS